MISPIVAGPAECQCCGKVVDTLYTDPGGVGLGSAPAKNLCSDCIAKRRRGEELPCDTGDSSGPAISGA